MERRQRQIEIEGPWIVVLEIVTQSRAIRLARQAFGDGGLQIVHAGIEQRHRHAARIAAFRHRRIEGQHAAGGLQSFVEQRHRLDGAIGAIDQAARVDALAVAFGPRLQQRS